MNTVMGSLYDKVEKFICFGSTQVVISDYSFYNRHAEEIEEWCSDTCANFRREGLVLFFKTNEDRTLFLLRWASDGH